MMRWNKVQNKIIAVSIPHLLYQVRNIGLTFILTAIFCSIIKHKITCTERRQNIVKGCNRFHITIYSISLLLPSYPSRVTASTGLFLLRLTVSTKVFHVVFVHMVYSSVLFFTSCCCSFLLHVVASLICIFSVSRPLVLLSNLPTIFHILCGQNGCTRLFFGKISSRMMSNLLCPFFL